MRRLTTLLAIAALAAQGGALHAQATVYTFRGADDVDRPRLGVSTRTSGKRDTLGLLIETVSRGGPADKAGIEEGDRLVSIDGVSLRLSAADAGEDDMDGVANRRLIRELAKHKAGDEVELRVYRDGQTRAVKAKVASVEELEDVGTTTLSSVRARLTERAALGISMGGNGSRRDTLGVLVIGVTDDGPAAKAGVEEGDRIAAINGVDLRVAREDAGDAGASSARMRRLSREMDKVKAGDEVELRLFANGQSRTVRVKSVRQADMPRNGGNSFFFGDGAVMPAIEQLRGIQRAMPAVPAPRAMVRPRVIIENDAPVRLREQLEKVQVEARTLRDRAVLQQQLQRQLETRLRTRTSPRVIIERSAPLPTVRPRILSGAVVSSGAPRPVRVAGATVLAASAPSRRVTATPAEAWTPDAVSLSSDAAGVVDLVNLRLARIDRDLASYFGRDSENGLLLVEVGGTWRNLQAGDVLLAVNGRAIRDGSGAISVRLRSGSAQEFEVLRNGRRVRITVYR